MRHASEPVLLCADHGVRLSSRITTDGDGTVVERVEACEICKRPRFTSRIALVADTPLTDAQCDELKAKWAEMQRGQKSPPKQVPPPGVSRQWIAGRLVDGDG